MNELAAISSILSSEHKFYTQASDYQLQLMKSFHDGKQPGETSFFSSLNDLFTLRPGFLYCFTGWPGSGKSEFLTQLAVLQGMFKDRSIAFYSPESYPVEEFIDSIVHCYLGKSTDKRFPNVCSQNEYTEGIKWVDKHFYFCDWAETPNTDLLLRSFEHLYKTKGTSIFVVDPFNSIVTEGEERNIAIALKHNLTAFKRFAAQNKVQVWLVEHPKTPNDTKEFDQIPGPRHLFGGTMWWNKVDVLATVHRPNRDDKHDLSVTFKTWKIKKQELNGRPGEQTIYFDIKSKRYYEDPLLLVHPMGKERIEPRLPYRDDTPDF